MLRCLNQPLKSLLEAKEQNLKGNSVKETPVSYPFLAAGGLKHFYAMQQIGQVKCFWLECSKLLKNWSVCHLADFYQTTFYHYLATLCGFRSGWSLKMQ